MALGHAAVRGAGNPAINDDTSWSSSAPDSGHQHRSNQCSERAGRDVSSQRVLPHLELTGFSDEQEESRGSRAAKEPISNNAKRVHEWPECPDWPESPERPKPSTPSKESRELEPDFRPPTASTIARQAASLAQRLVCDQSLMNELHAALSQASPEAQIRLEHTISKILTESQIQPKL